MPDGAFTFSSSGRPKRTTNQKKRRRGSDDEEPEAKKKPSETQEVPQVARKPKFSFIYIDIHFFYIFMIDSFDFQPSKIKKKLLKSHEKADKKKVVSKSDKSGDRSKLGDETIKSDNLSFEIEEGTSQDEPNTVEKGNFVT